MSAEHWTSSLGVQFARILRRTPHPLDAAAGGAEEMSEVYWLEVKHERLNPGVYYVRFRGEEKIQTLHYEDSGYNLGSWTTPEDSGRKISVEMGDLYYPLMTKKRNPYTDMLRDMFGQLPVYVNLEEIQISAFAFEKLWRESKDISRHAPTEMPESLQIYRVKFKPFKEPNLLYVMGSKQEKE